MGHSIFYLHPPKHDGFFDQGGSDFPLKEAHKISTLQTRKKYHLPEDHDFSNAAHFCHLS